MVKMNDAMQMDPTIREPNTKSSERTAQCFNHFMKLTGYGRIILKCHSKRGNLHLVLGSGKSKGEKMLGALPLPAGLELVHFATTVNCCISELGT